MQLMSNGKKMKILQLNIIKKELAEEYNTSRRNIVAFSKGFNTITEYYEDLSKKRGYESYSDGW